MSDEGCLSAECRGSKSACADLDGTTAQRVLHWANSRSAGPCAARRVRP
jgi:hypothetical protein